MSENATPVRVLLVDDHALLREGLRRSLKDAGYEVIGEASDGQQAIEFIEKNQPQVVLMDVTMPVLDGIEATKRISERFRDIRVVMLTMHSDADLARNALEAGAMGYLVKDCTTNDITTTINKALAGETTFPASVDVNVAAATKTTEKTVITAREAEVLQLIAYGKTTTEAAAELYVSVKTVKNHLASAYAKLDTHDRTQAVLRAARLGLIKLD